MTDLERIYRHLSVLDKIRLRDAILACASKGWAGGNYASGCPPLEHFQLLTHTEDDPVGIAACWVDVTRVTDRGRAMWEYIVTRDGLNEHPEVA